MSLHSYEDAQLWEAYRNGDNQALGIIAERYYRTLQRYGQKFGVDSAIVEDGIQDLFLFLGQNRERIGATGSVKFYLLKGLRNNILKYHRYHQRFQDLENDWLVEFPENINAEALLIEQETLSEILLQLKSLVESLPKREREALYLRYYENLSIPEIAEIMAVNKQSVSNFLQKALIKLRSKWAAVLVLFFNSL
jgi:RNA polymerase sigma factor (sigma-70 family)